MNDNEIINNINLIIESGSDNGDLMTINIKNLGSYFDFDFSNLNDLRQKKYFYRIEDV